MASPLTYEIHALDGVTQGVLRIKRSNWTGLGLAFPRSKWKEILELGEMQRPGPGVYILEGCLSETKSVQLYIGQSRNVKRRISQHDKKGKLWNRGIVFVSPGGGLNRDHVEWLEYAIIDQVRETGHCRLDNETVPHEPDLDIADKATAQSFLREILQILSLSFAGMAAFQPWSAVASPQADNPVVSDAALPESSPTGRDDPVQHRDQEEIVGATGKSTEHTDEQVKPLPSMDDTEYFKVLGFQGRNIVIQSKTTNQLLDILPDALTRENKLIEIAPLSWWRGQCGLSREKRLDVADALLEAARVPQIADVLDRAMGRGAHNKGSRIVYNLGDRVAVTGTDGKLSVEKRLWEMEWLFFRPGPAIKMVDDNHAPEFGRALYDAMMCYRWATSDDGRAFLGWIVSALIGGALPKPPIVSLVTPIDKDTTMLRGRLVPWLFDGAMRILSKATTVNLNETAASLDSLPCWLHEPESISGPRTRREGIIGLITQDRFSILVESGFRLELPAPDSSPLMPIRLGHQDTADWQAARTLMNEVTRPNSAAALRTHIIRHAPHIVRKTQEIRNELLSETEEAEARKTWTIAALTAGAGFLSDDYTPIRLSAVPQNIGSDTLHEIMATRIRVPAGNDISLGDLVSKSIIDQQWEHRELTVRYGFKLSRNTLLIAWNHDGMKSALHETPLASVNIVRLLTQIKGVRTTKNPRRFGHYRHRALIIPFTVCREHGLNLPSVPPTEYEERQ